MHNKKNIYNNGKRLQGVTKGNLQTPPIQSVCSMLHLCNSDMPIDTTMFESMVRLMKEQSEMLERLHRDRDDREDRIATEGATRMGRTTSEGTNGAASKVAGDTEGS